MFKAESMKEINLFLLGEDLKKVSGILYDLKLIEFFNINPEKFSKFEHKTLSDETSELLKLRSAISILKKHFKKSVEEDHKNPAEETLKLKNEEAELEKEILHLKDELKREKIFMHLEISKEDFKNKNLKIGYVPVSKADHFDSSFKTYRDRERIYFKTIKDKVKFSYKEVFIPKHFEKDIEKKLIAKKERLDKIEENFEKLANSSLRELQREEFKLSKEIAILEIRNKFAKSKNVSILSGFIPSKSFKKLKVALEEEVLGKYEIEVKDAGENAPIKLNNGFASSFESILKMYSLPKYNEFDPTILILLVFPIFFGFILGDVIYGLISLIVFTIAKSKLPKLKAFLSVLQISSIFSIFFGIIFGEFMGFELHGSYYGFFNRVEHSETLLLIGLIFGVIHLNIGLIVGFINEIKNLKKAICEKFSWFLMQIGAVCLYYGNIGENSELKIIGGVLIGIFVIMMFIAHGVLGLMDIPSFFTNVFSYARLMAVGLSSAAIAFLINEYTLIFFSKGIFGIIAGIILFTVGHVFNIVLGNFEGFLHTLRLHYVEFFTKFYHGDGEEFIPFGTHVHEKDE